MPPLPPRATIRRRTPFQRDPELGPEKRKLLRCALDLPREVAEEFDALSLCLAVAAIVDGDERIAAREGSSPS